MEVICRKRGPKALGSVLLHLVCFLLLAGWFLPAAHAAPPEPMLPEVYSGQVSVSGWLMSEKLDGVRGYWDGRRLWSKHGNLFHPPAAFVRRPARFSP